MSVADPQERAPRPEQLLHLRTMLQAFLPGTRTETTTSLAAAARTRRLQNGDVIFSQGEPVELAMCLRGYAAFRRTTVEGQQVMTAIASPGELYGLTSIAGTISTVDMFALNDGEVAVWHGPDVRGLAANDPQLALAVIDRLSSFLAILNEKVDGFLHQDARRRVIRILVRHRNLFFSEPPILSRAYLPALVGTSREMTGSVLRRLEQEGTIARVGRSGLRLLDPAGLELDDQTTHRRAG
ncbi:MAG TPA: Crp/Fnr family transcriptional regulator [Candidatus Limnocylindrales bacterium]|nr:Crp/Fnr family transcriptional regulator [Candidatus Limnocylindrales bacterium]